ncbi:MAG: universal stress protein [Solirubrobacterales bacterium]|nr:universal stress protein [Solirubrobacterales bacterium]MBV9717559.1 universal stress protein [Solirubrobacterales bacterium]
MFKSIVWASDGSHHSEKSLPYVTELARRDDATVTIAHVVERIEGAGVTGPPRRADEGDVQARLRELTQRLSDEGVNASLRICGEVGVKPAQELAKIARESNADLIVVGTRGRSAMAGVLLGSVAYRLLHVAPCPVLAVPPDAEEALERLSSARDRASTA